MIDIKEFAAVGDGKTNDTFAVQEAIDECSEKNEVLLVTAGIYKIGTVSLRDNTHIVFEGGAVFSGIADISAYSENDSCFVDAVGYLRGKTLVLAHKVKNVTVEGKGIITGNGANVETDKDRPFLFRIAECENIAIKDITLEKSISWCLHIFKSNNVDVNNVTIYNRGCKNNDGIDIDSSQNVRIDNCDISSDDDGVCIKTTSMLKTSNVCVKNCKISSNWAAFKIGTESVGNIGNVFVEDCEFYDVVGGGIKIVPTDGAFVNNVIIKNIVMINCTGPIFIANGERNREYAGEKSKQLSRIKNVEINGIEADVVSAPFRGYYDGEEWGNALGGVILSGTQKSKLVNIRLKNMNLSLPGGFCKKTDFNVREMGAMYPEFHRFDPVPAKGVYVRHAKDIFIDNIKITYKKADIREEFYSEDTENLVIN